MFHRIEEPRGNIRSNLQIIIGISLSSLSMFATVIVVDVKSLKKRLNLVVSCHTFFRRSSRNAMGSNLCLKDMTIMDFNFFTHSHKTFFLPYLMRSTPWEIFQ